MGILLRGRFSRIFILLILVHALTSAWVVQVSGIEKSNRHGPAAAGSRDSARLAWWRKARFGMFVHWGPVSLKGTEIGWSRGDAVPIGEYDDLYRRFNPTLFDAGAWAKAASEAGMKYLVFTTKHHDGFCMWDTRCTSYNIMNTPFHRDVVRELAAACRKYGLVFCIYHSICDWHHPDYPLGSPAGKTHKPSPDMDRYNQYLKDELAELIKGYGPLGIVWFDGEWEAPWTEERGQDLYSYCRNLQDSIIINNRVGKARNDMEGTSRAGAFSGDYDTPEQRAGKFQNGRPWESCITICEQWSWKPNDEMKTLKQCLQTLVTCAGGDGNLLLNVGPAPTGEIEPRQVERLMEIGSWMRRFGHTVYGTRGGPFKPGAWGASTFRGKRVFLHVYRWPEAGLRLPPVGAKILSARVLTGGRAGVRQQASGILIDVAAGDRQPIDTIVELVLNAGAGTIAPVDIAALQTAACDSAGEFISALRPALLRRRL